MLNYINRYFQLFVVCFLLFFYFDVLSQGNVEVIMDTRIDLLIKKQGEPIPPATSVQINGYRLQLLFDSNKSKIDNARQQFAKLYPKIPTYVRYNAPNYVLKVGDFRTQLEVDRLKAEVNASFPMCFVVREKINLPRID